ncbi:hypothetical protein SPAN111604_10920 [Sphingomonas antarctica]|uniref:hypothetical protein n=1 Tax=Sphingomonas antarctica TaxID=2040274 RepID=UPI0039EC1D8C
MSRPIIAALFALAATIPSVGRSEASYTIAIRGEVPLACRVALNGGKLHEFCNSGTGYRVYAAPSPELVGATLVVDGVRKLLTGQEVQVSSSTSPGIVDRAVALEDAPSGGSLSLRIEAI